MDIFVHIPKTAGSTIRSILKRIYGQSIFYFEPQNPKIVQSELFANLSKFCTETEDGLITGHYPYGIHDIIYKKSNYFAFIRDPMMRAVSNYYYAYQFDNHPHAEEIRNGKILLADYLFSGSFIGGGEQCAMIAGTYYNQENLAFQAIMSVETNYIYVGVTELFNRDLLILSKKMNWSNPFYLKRNATSFKDEWINKISETKIKYKSEIESYFCEDYSLYRYVCEKNKDICASYGASFTKSLREFEENITDIQNKLSTVGGDKYDFDEICDKELLAINSAIVSKRTSILRSFLYSSENHLPQHNYVGFLEECNDTRIKGWISDLTTEVPVNFRVVINNIVYGQFSPNIVRDDIDNLLHRKNCMTGFDIDLGVASKGARVFPGRRETPIAILKNEI